MGFPTTLVAALGGALMWVCEAMPTIGMRRGLLFCTPVARRAHGPVMRHAPVGQSPEHRDGRHNREEEAEAARGVPLFLCPAHTNTVPATLPYQPTSHHHTRAHARNIQRSGYLFTYYNAKVTEERKARIERCNTQVRDLYGPLLATVNATRAAYAAMVRQASPDGTTGGFVAAARARPEGREGHVYRTWMRDVLQPLNERAAAIVVDHADLLEEAAMPPALLQLVAHVSANRVVLARWSAGDLAEQSAITYPDTLHAWVAAEFAAVKARQAALLGVSPPPGGGDGGLGGEKVEAARPGPSGAGTAAGREGGGEADEADPPPPREVGAPGLLAGWFGWGSGGGGGTEAAAGRGTPPQRARL
jgi:hypothetical protein